MLWMYLYFKRVFEQFEFVTCEGISVSVMDIHEKMSNVSKGKRIIGVIEVLETFDLTRGIYHQRVDFGRFVSVDDLQEKVAEHTRNGYFTVQFAYDSPYAPVEFARRWVGFEVY